MKSRAVALGASVVALTIAGAGQARAAGPGALPDVRVQVPDTGVVAKVDANVSAPLIASKASLKVDARVSGRPPTTTKPEHGTAGGAAAAVETKQDLSVRSDRHRIGRLTLVGEGRSHRARAESTVTGTTRRGGKVRVHSAAKPGHVRVERPIRAHSRPEPMGGGVPAPDGPKRLTLKGIGQEVGNPAHLILGGWLLVLLVSGGFAVGRLARRLQRTV